MIVLDTSVLSLAFRRRRRTESEPSVVRALRRLIEEDTPLAVPGIVLQELLSGVRTDGQFSRLRRLMEPFPIVLAEHRHHLSAARIANECRRHGLVTSAVDCLIAAISISRNAHLFTLDEDFARMMAHCQLRLFAVGLTP